MKRGWYAVALLVLLLILGLLASGHVRRLTEPVAEQLTLAAEAIRQEDPETAGQLLAEARRQWQKNWVFLAAMNHHGPMEEIDSRFARAEALLECAELREFTGCCAELEEMIRALGESHALRPENLL